MLIKYRVKDTAIHASWSSLSRFSDNSMDFSFPFFDGSPEYIIFIVFLASSAGLLMYTIFVWLRFAIFKSSPDQKQEFPPCSVIIAARNEEENLYSNLEYVLTQDYPKFEVIVVNHQSVDGSKQLLLALQKQFSFLRIVEIERDKHLSVGKKLPLTLGIKAAQYEHLVFTDADCKPNSDSWLKQMVAGFSDKKEIVLGFGPYKQQGSFLGKLIAFDTLFIASNYFSFALMGLPYMGVGRNLAYKKRLFEQVGGYKSHYGIPSGDDDLFIQEAATKNNVSIVIDPSSHCYSDPKEYWGDWFRQKKRHFRTAPRYPLFTKALLGFFPFCLTIQLFCFVSLLFFSIFSEWIFACFGFSLIFRWLIQGINFKKLGDPKTAWLYPILEYVHLMATTVIFYSKNKRKGAWS